VTTSQSRPFTKYERFGAYHWREIEPIPTRHNAILTARYRVLLNAMNGGVRRVLDIGSGDGTLTHMLGDKAEQVYGIDDSLLPLRLALDQFRRRRASRQPHLSAADARSLPFPDDTFDCVVLADVIEHIDAPEPVMRETRRVLRRGGQILLTTPRRQSDQPGHEYHCREYTGDELAGLLGRWFTDVRVRAFQPARIARLYQSRLFGRKVFRVAINCLAIAGWNPLVRSASVDDEARHTDLCASGRKS
jgi:ubiquinone/menaquinone biosynthesis C-methylase UbiE